MSRRGFNSEDASTLLYIVPFALSAVYALVLWAQQGLSYYLPKAVFLDVTRDPYIFIVGSLAVFAGMAVELSGTEAAKRAKKLTSLGNSLQAIAAASLVFVVIAALYANGFGDLQGAASDVIVGRYGLVFPVVLVLMSFLLSSQFNLSSLMSRSVLGIVLLLLVPVSIRELGKRSASLGLASAFLLLVLGALVFLYPKKGAPPKEGA